MELADYFSGVLVNRVDAWRAPKYSRIKHVPTVDRNSILWPWGSLMNLFFLLNMTDGQSSRENVTRSLGFHYAQDPVNTPKNGNMAKG